MHWVLETDAKTAPSSLSSCVEAEGTKYSISRKNVYKIWGVVKHVRIQTVHVTLKRYVKAQKDDCLCKKLHSVPSLLQTSPQRKVCIETDY